LFFLAEWLLPISSTVYKTVSPREHKIIAYHVSKRNDLSLVMKNTGEKACENREVVRTLIHSDQGYQYTSRQYNKKLEQLGMVGSHLGKGNSLDNACIESFFSHLKSEMLLLQCPETLELCAYSGIPKRLL
jgi:transposase InsO family protein